MYYIISYHIILYYIIPYHIILYYIILYYIILYYIILYYNLIGPPSYMRSVVDRNVVTRRIGSNDRFNERGDRAYSLIFKYVIGERHTNHLSHSQNHKVKCQHSMTRSVGCRQLRHMTTLVNKLHYLRLCLTGK